MNEKKYKCYLTGRILEPNEITEVSNTEKIRIFNRKDGLFYDVNASKYELFKLTGKNNLSKDKIRNYIFHIKCNSYDLI